MNWLTTIFGTVAYTLIGLLFMDLVNKHIMELEKEVAKIDKRYLDRLWLRVSLKKSLFMERLVDILFIVFWPAICIAAVLKAEWEYDLVVNHSAFVRRDP